MADPPPPSYDQAVGGAPPCGESNPLLAAGQHSPLTPQQTKEAEAFGQQSTTGYPAGQPGYQGGAPYPPPPGPYPPPQQGPSYPPSQPSPSAPYPPADPAYPPPTAPGYPPGGQDPAYPPSQPPHGAAGGKAYPPPQPGAYPPPPGDQYPPSAPGYRDEDFEADHPGGGNADEESDDDETDFPIKSDYLLKDFSDLEPEIVTEPGFCTPADSSGLWCCRIFFSFLAHVGFICGVTGLVYGHIEFDDYAFYVCTILTGVSYGVLWLELWCSHDMQFLCRVKSVEEFTDYMKEMHEKWPQIEMSVKCYHYEKRYRTVYYTDSHGNRRSKKESYYEKVVTHQESENFRYQVCNNLTPPTINIEGFRATRITFHRYFMFGNEATKEAYRNQKVDFKARNRNKDKHMDFKEEFHLEGFKKRMLAYVKPEANHCCFNPCAYILLSFIVCTWPYRWWFKATTGAAEYNFVKEMRV